MCEEEMKAKKGREEKLPSDVGVYCVLFTEERTEINNVLTVYLIGQE